MNFICYPLLFHSFFRTESACQKTDLLITLKMSSVFHEDILQEML